MSSTRKTKKMECGGCRGSGLVYVGNGPEMKLCPRCKGVRVHGTAGVKYLFIRRRKRGNIAVTGIPLVKTKRKPPRIPDQSNIPLTRFAEGP